MTTTKKVTRLTSDGLVVRVADDSVIGWKCLGCSTTHIAEPEDKVSVEQLADYISMCMDAHEYCGVL